MASARDREPSGFPLHSAVTRALACALVGALVVTAAPVPAAADVPLYNMEVFLGELIAEQRREAIERELDDLDAAVGQRWDPEQALIDEIQDARQDYAENIRQAAASGMTPLALVASVFAIESATDVFLREELREPPPEPPPPPPRPPPTPEEKADQEKMGAFFDRMVRNSRRRQLPWWHELTSEGRVLLGCLPAEDGPGWLDMFHAADDLGAVEWYATLRRFSDAVELALEHGLIDSSAGMVRALELIATELWRDRDHCTAVFPPEEVRAIRQRLDEVLEEHGGEDKFVRWLKKKERHWKIAIPRAALAALREHLDRAIETGSWLLWLPDSFDWPGER